MKRVKNLIVVVFLSLLVSSLEAQSISVDIKNIDTRSVKDKIVYIMSKDYYKVITSNDYALDLRKDFQPGEDAWNRAVINSFDGCDTDSHGVEFSLMPSEDGVTVHAFSYMFKTFRYGRKEPAKENMMHNSNYYNQSQDILTKLKFELSQKQTTTFNKAIKILSPKEECQSKGGSWYFSNSVQSMKCSI